MQQHVWVNHAALSWNRHIFTLKSVLQLFLIQKLTLSSHEPRNAGCYKDLQNHWTWNHWSRKFKPALELIGFVLWIFKLALKLAGFVFFFWKYWIDPDQTKRFSLILKIAKPENLWFPVKITRTSQHWLVQGGSEMLGFVHSSVKIREAWVLKGSKNLVQKFLAKR
jgi:hypothetical protein